MSDNAMMVLFFCWAAAVLIALGSVGYVAVHFIQKFW
jgi:hypothetical protein